MTLDLQQERQQAHALLDLLPPAKLGAVCSLLEVMIDDDGDDEMTDADRAAIEAGLASLARGEGIPHDEILREFGLTAVDCENVTPAPDPVAKRIG